MHLTEEYLELCQTPVVDLQKDLQKEAVLFSNELILQKSFIAYVRRGSLVFSHVVELFITFTPTLQFLEA